MTPTSQRRSTVPAAHSSAFARSSSPPTGVALLLTTTEAARRLGIGRSTLYDLIRSRRLRTVKIGSRRLVPVDALPDVIALLTEETAA